MKINQIKTPEDLVNYIMQEYEKTETFNDHELENIKSAYEEWADYHFERLRNEGFKDEGFKDLDKRISASILIDFEDFVRNREDYLGDR